MNKNGLKPGRKYLRRRHAEIGRVSRTAERWLRCERITDTGAVFSRDFEPEIELTDEEIERELMEEWGK